MLIVEGFGFTDKKIKIVGMETIRDVWISISPSMYVFIVLSFCRYISLIRAIVERRKKTQLHILSDS